MVYYGDKDDVQTFIGDVVPQRTFGADTNPTDTQIKRFLRFVSAELNMCLEAYGYILPISKKDYPYAFESLNFAASLGAASLVIMSLPSPQGLNFEDDKNASRNRVTYFNARYKKILEKIEMRKFPGERSREQLDTFVGSETRPVFYKGLTDFPGTRYGSFDQIKSISRFVV